MSNQIISKPIALPIITILLGGWLGLIAHSSPAQAQTKQNHGVLLTQAVFENLPPPPNVPTQGVEFNQNQYDQNYYQPAQNQYSQNFQRYVVYVDSANNNTLRQVKRIEPSAYIRQYNGRSVIQAGVFNRQSNAQQRVRELELSGIYGGRVLSFGDGGEIPNSPGGGNYSNQKPRYYVSIPAKSQELPSIADRIRLTVGQYGLVSERRQPLGPHVAVGPFLQRNEAEQWNKYLRNMGFGNARVYYGK
ncbi:hypothetical protein [Nostoc sp. TCL26-01]|uniref:hypothetical protein n=1 Tax=Nostoc sp. TCL26-01 TaxID=2576904 RepID=UPI0015BF50E6|nr:hypothetical protein [Nostoc sp. TCL26-01]QLE54712.1 hypothetical protein FD725_03835 [Nostoc sp. TCL26-01]